MDYVMDAYCGLYCGACPNLLATKTGKAKNQCHGCKSEQPTSYCLTCTIKACAIQKGFEFCSQCSEFSTCAQIQKFAQDAPDELSVMKNLEMIQSDGLPKWLQRQNGLWRCVTCSGSLSWFDESCPQCGQPVIKASTSS